MRWDARTITPQPASDLGLNCFAWKRSRRNFREFRLVLFSMDLGSGGWGNPLTSPGGTLWVFLQPPPVST